MRICCDFCGKSSSILSKVKKDGIDVYLCQKCKHQKGNPIVVEGEVNSFFETLSPSPFPTKVKNETN